MTKENRTFPPAVSKISEEENSYFHHSALNNVLIVIGCLTFFPLVYLIGRMIVQWAG